MAGDGGVIAEDCVFDDRLAGLHGLEEVHEVGTHVVPIVAVIESVIVRSGSFPSGWVVFRVPLLDVFVAHFLREAELV